MSNLKKIFKWLKKVPTRNYYAFIVMPFAMIFPLASLAYSFVDSRKMALIIGYFTGLAIVSIIYLIGYSIKKEPR